MAQKESLNVTVKKFSAEIFSIQTFERGFAFTICAVEATTDEPFVKRLKPHDIAKFFANQSDSKLSEFLEFYRKGLYSSNTSLQTNVPVSIARSSLIQGGIIFRMNKKFNGATVKDKAKKQSVTHLGYVIYEGEMRLKLSHVTLLKQVIFFHSQATFIKAIFFDSRMQDSQFEFA